ncbi:hypothetical protein M011DRAFT_450125 [Sporormia fimetaria CBS 119925]|uniref:C2H2-type domain-containing protein n=1 Tax=Sporormia fimetaria CBS 119925 TaxID=1340428 RepID=A0A6A6V152_9PLEO|nr:hypothetical protein M011DRAFT_450125 [Sporormia fimetaria CBS 119925]
MAEPFQTVPHINWVQAYLRWRARTGIARLGTTITVNTLHKEFQQIRRCLRLARDFSWSNKVVQAVKKYIDNLAKTEGACTATREKTLAYALDADEIQFYLWNCSEYVYAHPRAMVQFSFLLHIISVWGLRTGEITESTSHQGSNEGIKYGDVSLSLARCDKGALQYQITIALRNRKFCRGNEGKVKKITLREHMDPTQRYRCPIRKFLALALADDVFVNQRLPEDFDNRWIRPTASSRVFEIKEEKRNLPLCRKIDGLRVSETRMQTASSLNRILKDICEQCGYTEPVTTYTFRRGVANKVEANASQKGTKEVLGHKGDRTWHAYAAPTIGTDAQAIAYDKPQDTDYFQFAQSIAYTRDLGAPKPANATLGILCIPSEDVIRAVAQANPTYRSSDIMKKARREQYKINRQQFRKAVRSEASPVSDVPGGDDFEAEIVHKELGKTIPVCIRPVPSPEFTQMLKYNPLQARVIETLWHRKEASLAECVQPLMELANPEPFRVFYPRPALPPNDDGTCPYCKKDILSRYPHHSRLALHLLDCYCNTQNVRFCFDCTEFIDQKPGTRHCCPPGVGFDPNNQVYGVITWRGLIIRKGRCPYKLCCNSRYRHAQDLQRHIEDHHLTGLQDEPLTCPHPACGEPCNSREELRTHLHTTHKIHLVRKRDLLAKIGVRGKGTVANEAAVSNEDV